MNPIIDQKNELKNKLEKLKNNNQNELLITHINYLICEALNNINNEQTSNNNINELIKISYNNKYITDKQLTDILSIINQISDNKSVENLSISKIVDTIIDINNNPNSSTNFLLKIDENLSNEDQNIPYFHNFESGKTLQDKIKDKFILDFENIIITKNMYQDILSNDISNKDSLDIEIVSNSGKKLTLNLWFKWKQYIHYLNEGTTCNLINVYSNDYPVKDEIHLFKESLLVIEPDFLINASSLSQAVVANNWCLYPYYLNIKKRKVTNNLRAIKGIIIGEILDEYLRDTEYFVFNKTYNEILLNHYHKLCFLPYKEYKEILYLKNDLLFLFKNLKNNLWNKNTKYLPQYSEPLFISPKYGLIGRFDMFYTDKKNKKAIIYELKSGRAPNINNEVWSNHRYQLECYNYILHNHEFYSDIKRWLVYARSSKPVFEIKGDIDKNVIYLRNHIVNLHKWIENPDKFPYPFKENLACKNCKSYSKRECKKDIEFNKTNEDSLKYKYINYFTSLLEKEKIENYKLLSRMWKLPIQQRKKNFNICDELKIESINNSELILSHKQRLNTDFRIGDSVYLYQDNAVGNELLRATIKQIDIYNIKIQLFKKPNFEGLKNDWIIERDYPTSSLESQQCAVDEFIKSGERKIDLLFNKTDPNYTKRENLHWDDIKNLNAEQIEAFQKCLSAKDYCLVQGPPGTGKTHVIVELVKELVRRGEKVLISAFTNRAIDNILLKLLQNGFNNFLRIGSYYNIEDDIKPYTINKYVNHYYNDNFTEKDLYTFRDKITSIPVFAVTSTSAMSTLIFDYIYFDTVIIDEAGQMTEPSSLAVIKNGKKFCMFGDIKQLPPVIQSNQLNIDIYEELKNIEIENLSRSLFERLWILNLKKNDEMSNPALTMLKEQYRMHKDIMYFSNNAFYNNKLKASKQIADKTLTDIEYYKYDEQIEHPYNELLKPERTICLYDYKINNFDDIIDFKRNDYESRIAANLANHLINMGIAAEDIGIIAPFKAQCAQIYRDIEDLIDDDFIISSLVIDTVERFQGKEKQVIIMSLTTTDKNNLDILLNSRDDFKRKFNVAITRAKLKLIVIGNFESLKNCDILNEFYKECYEGKLDIFLIF